MHEQQYKAIQIDHYGNEVEKPFVRLEIAQNSNLFEFIKYVGMFDDAICRYYFKQLIYII